MSKIVLYEHSAAALSGLPRERQVAVYTAFQKLARHVASADWSGAEPELWHEPDDDQIGIAYLLDTPDRIAVLEVGTLQTIDLPTLRGMAGAFVKTGLSKHAALELDLGCITGNDFAEALYAWHRLIGSPASRLFSVGIGGGARSDQAAMSESAWFRSRHPTYRAATSVLRLLQHDAAAWSVSDARAGFKALLNGALVHAQAVRRGNERFYVLHEDLLLRYLEEPDASDDARFFFSRRAPVELPELSSGHPPAPSLFNS